MHARIALVICIAALFFVPVSGYMGHSTVQEDAAKGKIGGTNNTILDRFDQRIEIPPGEDFYLRVSPQQGLQSENRTPLTHNLSERQQKAVCRAPVWLRSSLTRRLRQLNDSYAELLLQAPATYVDEIGFSMAFSPEGAVPSPDVLLDNARFIYKHDRLLDYVSLVEGRGEAGSYTTIRYRVLESGQEKMMRCPPSIYYWYVVSPRLSIENATHVYDTFWREYLIHHNDRGYPLLKEKLSDIRYLWDRTSYRPPGQRTWQWSMDHHPTAVETINYWVGKTLPALATGNRPLQPNRVYHGHNGLCGEIQELSVSAMRASLIPSIPVDCMGEDHAWCEFWERGWHEFDEWWADGGGSIDNFDEYRYGWGKIMSALIAWRGDSSIYDVTDHYIDPGDRGTVTVTVRDTLGNPVDGARVMVFGSWKANDKKDALWQKTVGKLWQRLPDDVQEQWREEYQQAWGWWHERVPGLVPWVVPSTWNYTGVDGECSFQLGTGHSYLFVVQKGELHPLVGKSNAVRYKATVFPRHQRDISVRFTLPDQWPRFDRHRELSPPEGTALQIDGSFDTAGYQTQRNPWDWNMAREQVSSALRCFVVNRENFERYRNGKRYDCYGYRYGDSGKLSFNGSQREWYMVFHNPSKRTRIVANLSVSLQTEAAGDFISLTEPWTPVFEVPTANVGDTVTLQGVCSGSGVLEVAGTRYPVNGNWSVNWNTSSLSPGVYEVTAQCGDSVETHHIHLIDAAPPAVSITQPGDGAVVTGNVTIRGRATDNTGIASVDLHLDGEWRSVPANFSIVWNPPHHGTYKVQIRATDRQGLQTASAATFTVDTPDRRQGPVINEVWHTPPHPNTTSNVVVYANVTAREPFPVKKVELLTDNETQKMWRYAAHPVQERDSEDPLRNESNAPVYGRTLAQLPRGTITCRVQATDTAGHTATSEAFVIEVE